MRVFKERGERPQWGVDTPYKTEKMNKLLKRKEKGG
jgi:hypothetical protein